MKSRRTLVKSKGYSVVSPITKDIKLQQQRMVDFIKRYMSQWNGEQDKLLYPYQEEIIGRVVVVPQGKGKVIARRKATTSFELTNDLGINGRVDPNEFTRQYMCEFIKDSGYPYTKASEKRLEVINRKEDDLSESLMSPSRFTNTRITERAVENAIRQLSATAKDSPKAIKAVVSKEVMDEFLSKTPKMSSFEIRSKSCPLPCVVGIADNKGFKVRGNAYKLYDECDIERSESEKDLAKQLMSNGQDLETKGR